MLKFFTLSVFILSFISIQAQVMPSMPSGGGTPVKIYDGKISGTVTYQENETPVEFANIALYKTNSNKPLDGTVTDEKGNFVIKKAPTGKFRLMIHHPASGWLGGVAGRDGYAIVIKEGDNDVGKREFGK